MIGDSRCLSCGEGPLRNCEVYQRCCPCMPHVPCDGDGRRREWTDEEIVRLAEKVRAGHTQEPFADKILATAFLKQQDRLIATQCHPCGKCERLEGELEEAGKALDGAMAALETAMENPDWVAVSPSTRDKVRGELDAALRKIRAFEEALRHYEGRSVAVTLIRFAVARILEGEEP